MTVFTRLSSDEPLKDPERFERPHGDECSCDECLLAWTKLVAARYIHICRSHEIPGTDLVLIVDTRVKREVEVWQRADRLRYLKAATVARSEPYKPLHLNCDARPIKWIPV